MESLFPQILYVGPMYVPLILRIAAAITLALMARHYYVHRATVAEGQFPIIGKPGMIVAWLAVALSALIAVALATGLYTQGAAILGVLAALKGLIWSSRYPTMFPAGRLAYFLLAVICAALILTGAGAFAFDKPY